MPTKPPKRGRTSLTELMTPTNPLEREERPPAPYELSDDEAAREWDAIVATMPADHFMKANHPLLVQYCRHIVAARRLDQLIASVMKSKKFDAREYAHLLQLQNAESQAIQRLARSMRLTQQSVTRADASKKGRGVNSAPQMIEAPWNSSSSLDEIDDDE